MEYNGIKIKKDIFVGGVKLPIIKYCSHIYEFNTYYWENTNELPFDELIFYDEPMFKNRKYGFILFEGMTIIKGEMIIL